MRSTTQAVARHARWQQAAERADGCRSVFLDSRPEVIGFYAAAGYAPHTAVLVRKPL